ncbi:hypothetical protein CGC49_06305 [Capnocytophaga sp. H4358]|uniref:Lipoprotein n=1 Tax=Capnocytophaga canis TaxID=1848903 RepID=A0A3A1YI76_9FLAO|nr:MULTISPECIES: hypothetical protein [Capnocytophaga]ATA72921.1 hypothetical protein CGC49_06305 [Capnocytophaga sp. H4358]RIY36908.1 hypothetical protein CKY20_05110 [Capnocytophaga canis]
MRFFLLAICCAILGCSSKEQDLRIYVSGKVSNESGEGISNVKIQILRGKIGHYAATRYSNYETIHTNHKGEFNYTIQNDTYVYKICCELPSGYESVTPSCKEIDHSIVNGGTIFNVISFKLVK